MSIKKDNKRHSFLKQTTAVFQTNDTQTFSFTHCDGSCDLEYL